PRSSAFSQGVRTFDLVLDVDGTDPSNLVGVSVPGEAHSLTFADAEGTIRTAYLADVSWTPVFSLIACGLLFGILGALVYRWSADAALGRSFAFLSGAFATALVAAPANLLGHPWPGYLAGPAALLAAPGLLCVFLYFPRPLRS